MNVLARLATRFSTVGELFVMVMGGSRLWLLPMFVVFALAAVLLAVVQVLEYVAPFVYTVF